MRVDAGPTPRDAGASWAPEELERVEACPVCGSGEGTTLHDGLEDGLAETRGRWTLRSCLGCGAAYLDPRPKAAAIGRAYGRYFTHEEPADPSSAAGAVVGLWRPVRNGYVNATLGYRLEPAVPLARLALAPFPVRRRHARRLVSDLPHPGERGRLLDVGCGNGRLLVTMRWAGWHVEGVEPDPGAVAAARRRGLTVHQGTLADAALPGSSFDAITMDNVLEHVPAPVETLELCRRLLRPEGVLWIATPNLASAGHRRYGVDWIGLEAPRHLVLFSASPLRRALASAGFEVEFLQPPRVGRVLARSEELRARRRRLALTRVRRAKIALAARLRDWWALREPTAGEELVVVARPAARGDPRPS